MIKTLKTLCLISLAFPAYAAEYHVSGKNGADGNDGSQGKPFKTIMAAAGTAKAGDTITVHEGTYREWVNPPRGGDSDTRRITYQAAKGEKVILKGSEEIKGWKKEEHPGVWKVVIPNEFFGDHNPYKTLIEGDWFSNHRRNHHTGEVFLNGKGFWEMPALEQVIASGTKEKADNTYTWYCESSDKETTIWAQFHDSDPNKELVEISTRRTCFFPEKEGINYITLRGFEICQAATQWAAPTAEQVGMVATHWNKGWIIEDNIIHDSRCNGITLGKEKESGHNVWSADKSRDGSLHYIDTIDKVLKKGWGPDKIGSHIVRNNVIYNCEQTGICGSMGCAFSEISNNHIYNIWTRRQFSGAEIAGIKFHGAIDTLLKNNLIHKAGRGIWLDWMTQGTRVSGNVLYDNSQEDLFLEVNHGPYIVDNNIMLSRTNVKCQSQGGAFVHNLFTGQIHTWPEGTRKTPYHYANSTKVKGYTNSRIGDDRFYNNILVPIHEGVAVNLHSYNKAVSPVWIENNVYCGASQPSDKDKSPLLLPESTCSVTLVTEGKQPVLNIKWDKEFARAETKLVTTKLLGISKTTELKYTNPDGSDVTIDTDILGKNVRPKSLSRDLSNIRTGKILKSNSPGSGKRNNPLHFGTGWADSCFNTKKD